MADEDSDNQVDATPNALLAEGSSDEEEEVKMSQEDLDKGLLQAVKEDNIEKCTEFLAMGGQTNYEQDGWNALLWAARNGNEDIVRVLIKHGATSPYLSSKDDKKEGSTDPHEEEKDPFQKPQDASKTG